VRNLSVCRKTNRSAGRLVEFDQNLAGAGSAHKEEIDTRAISSVRVAGKRVQCRTYRAEFPWRGPRSRNDIRPAEYFAEFLQVLGDCAAAAASREVKTSIESPPGRCISNSWHPDPGEFPRAAASRWLREFSQSGRVAPPGPRSRGDCFLRAACTTLVGPPGIRGMVGQRAPRAVNFRGRRDAHLGFRRDHSAIARKNASFIIPVFYLSWTRRPAQGCRVCPVFWDRPEAKSASLPAEPGHHG